MTIESNFNYAPETVKDEWYDLMKDYFNEGSGTPREEWEHFTPQFVDTKVTDFNLASMATHIANASEMYVESKLSQKEANLHIDTDLPIGIVHLGDLHLGSIYTDTQEVLRKLDVVKKTPNLYVAWMSNLIDNAIPSQYPVNMLVNAIPPDKQVLMIRSIVQDLDEEGRVIGAVTSPCHEGWTYKHTGQDINALMFGYEGRNFPVLQNGGILHLTVGKQEYNGALFHKVGPFESNFNKSHALKQLHRLNLGMDMDWIAGAHRHYSTSEVTYEGNGDDRRVVAYVRTGTEKGTGDIHDDWIVGRYGRTGEPTGQLVHLFPNEKRIMSTLHFDDAVMAHEAFYLYSMAKRDGII